MAGFICDVCGGKIKMQANKTGMCQSCGMVYEIEAIRAMAGLNAGPAPAPPVDRGKPWETGTAPASSGVVRSGYDNQNNSPDKNDKTMVFRLSPQGQNSINRIPLGVVFGLIVIILLIILMNNLINEYPEWYYELKDEFNPVPAYKFARICFIIGIFEQIIRLFSYLTNRDAMEQTRCEICDDGISIYYFTNFWCVFRSHYQKLTWSNIFSAQEVSVLSVPQLSLRFRDPYSLKVRGALLKIENARICADIIRLRAGLQSGRNEKQGNL